MGFKQIDLLPLASPSAISPASKQEQLSAFIVRPSVTASTVMAVLPANASITDVTVIPNVAATDSTNAAVSVGSGASTNNLINAASMTTTTVVRASLAGGLALAESSVPGSDVTIRAIVTGAAATVGTTVVIVKYVT